jgi:fermentation-respiration switch protein FrsA (DUF1100 family)
MNICYKYLSGGAIMKEFLRILLLSILLGTALAFSGCSGGGGGSDDSSNSPDTPAPTDVVQPLALPGPYAVACTNVAQDFSQISDEEEAKSFWEGTDGYVTDLLTDPNNTLIARVIAPLGTDLYGSFAGDEVEFTVIACYPTTADNARPDYPLPTGDVIPHMQTGSDPPLFADASARYPVVAFSHGFGDSPISSSAYITAMSTFASYGYIVIAPFHGDFRFSNLNINDLSDVIAIALNLENFTALQALRPLAISAALNLVLQHPQWLGHINESQIGGFGASMGSETMMLLGGAGLTTSYFNIGESWKQVTRDTRIKAAVGYIPYFGQPILPAFGREQAGLDDVSLPFLGISGTADTVAPISMVEMGMARLNGTRELVALSGVEHGFDVPSTNDIFTWALMFLDAEVRGNTATKAQLSTMASVAGGGNDSVIIFYNGL